MTDLQAITVMLARAELAWSIEPTRNSDATAGGRRLPPGTTITVSRVDDDTPRMFGYFGFYAEFYFDAEGALVGMGAWE